MPGFPPAVTTYLFVNLILFLFSGKTPGRCYFMPQNYGKYFNYQNFFFIFVLGQKNPDMAQVVPG
jgi:hypothetical protein